MESMDVCNERHTLTAELAQVLAMARELEAHMDQDSAAARELCRALVSSIDKSIRIARSCFPESPRSAAGSPRGDDQDPAGGNASKDTQFKKRKGMPKVKVRSQVRVRSVQDVGPLDDGLSWRKYGQKDILGAKYPRAYFRCTHRHTQGCHATKQVQRADGDPLLFDVVYIGAHTCAQAAQPTGAQRPSSLVSAEQLPLQPGHAGQEQSSLLAVETEGIQGLEPITPFSFPSTPVGIDGYGCFPFASQASSECQLSSSYDYAAGGLGVDMDFETQLDEFFLNPSEFFHSEIQNM